MRIDKRRASVAGAVLMAVLFGIVGSRADEPATSPTKAPIRLAAPALPNAYRLNERVISGGLPEGDAAFQQLSDLGVKTIISVDGMTPDVEAARRHGLRYVHLPHGYDQVPVERCRELAKAVRDLPGPVYIHCHHGKHRSPAAAAVACIGAGLMDPSEAEAVLKVAGTNPNYRGLFESVRNARPLTAAELDALKVDFRETAPVPPLAEAMVKLDHSFDRLKELSAADWKPADEVKAAALLLLEDFDELQRIDEVRRRPDAFRKLLQQHEATARTLSAALASEAVDVPAAKKAMSAITAGCVQCHAEYRDNN